MQEIHCDTLTLQHVCRQMLMHGEGRGVPLIQVCSPPPLSMLHNVKVFHCDLNYTMELL